MDALGLGTFAVVGHDRGACVGYRLALDHPARVERYASLTMVPTPEPGQSFDQARRLANFQWTFFTPAERPARAPTSGRSRYLHRPSTPAHILAAYRKAFRDPAARHVICEDYRAGAQKGPADDLAD